MWNDAALNAAYTVLDGVDATEASVVAAEVEIGYFVETGALPGTEGETIVLKAGNPGPYVGTAGDDTFQGILGNGATFQTFDKIDGAAGVNTFELVVNGVNDVNLPVSTSVSNIQIVELASTNGATVNNLTSGAFGSAVEEVWQIGSAADITLSANGQVAGFEGANLTTVTAAAGVESVTTALAGVAAGQFAVFDETVAGTLKSVLVSGSVADNGSIIVDTTATTATSTIDLALSKSGTVGLAVDNSVVTTIDASESTGGLTINASAITSLTTLSGGTAADTLTVVVDNLMASSLEVSGGAGNDTLNVDVWNAASGATSLFGDEGSDKFVIDANAGNIASAANFAKSLITVEDFNAATDVLDINTGLLKDTLNNQELANISAADTLSQALNIASSYINDGQYALFNYDGDAYVLSDITNGASFSDGDGLIKIAGVSTGEFNNVNFV